MIYKLNINHNPKERGTKGSQVIPDQEKLGIKELYNFFIYENNFFANVGNPIPFKFNPELILKKN